MKRRLNILSINQFFFPDSQGGVERVAHETAKRLAERGHIVHLVGQRMEPGTPDTEELYGLTVHRYGNAESRGRMGGRTRDALYASRRVLSELVAKQRFDVVLPHHYFPYYSYIGNTGRKTIPELMTFHASYWQELRLEGAERRTPKLLEQVIFGRMARRTEVACLKRADRIAVLSDFSAEQLSSYYSFATGKVVKIPGGVDLERFTPASDRNAVRKRLNLPVDRQILLTVRRLVPRMGLSNLVTAFGEVLARHPEAMLVIAGRGRLEQELKRQVVEGELSNSVRFTGFVDDDRLVDYYRAADLFVLPSVAFEGFGMVTLEALACGTPALGTPIGATPEILKPLAPQLVLRGTRPAALRRGIGMMLEWLSDARAAEELRKRCREYVESSFGWDAAVDALERLIFELTDAGRRDG
jgi:glycosyltransferase involved in cell wall biosynthesis